MRGGRDLGECTRNVKVGEEAVLFHHCVQHSQRIGRVGLDRTVAVVVEAGEVVSVEIGLLLDKRTVRVERVGAVETVVEVDACALEDLQRQPSSWPARAQCDARHK